MFLTPACVCAGATVPADEAAGAAAAGERGHGGEEGDHRPAPGGHGPQLQPADLKGRTGAHQTDAAAQNLRDAQGLGRGFGHFSAAAASCSVYLTRGTFVFQHVEECEMMLKGLKERQETVGGWLAQEKQRLAETCGASFVLNTKSENLQDNKEGVSSTDRTVLLILVTH